ncbi:ribonuclease domain-containing protein [Nocardioides sp. SYSU DS0663]|uniref:ribonuclease domain-containing protein n=1 Tax=Nocardioides sp. SYSU DS0663 TaxID=3416445 RepID=UPI003F4C565A
MGARTKAVAAAAAAIVLVVLGLVLGGGSLDGAPDADRGRSGLPTVLLDELPPEARRTVQRIEEGGPFPEDEDGTVFHNYEDLLPDRDDGYYREYTVPTPGLGHRGPRRIVEGAPGEWYWTADHYASFAEVVR